MGCAPSSPVHSENAVEADEEMTEWTGDFLKSEDPHMMLASYVETEKTIQMEESKCPASALGLALSRKQQIKLLLEQAHEKVEKSGGLIPEDNSIYDLFRDLGLHRRPSLAAEHEEFIANINRMALNTNMSEILERRLEGLEKTIEKLTQDVGKLRSLYEKQDLILTRIYGGSFGSEKEMLLEDEIDTMKNYRDAFSSGVFQWQASGDNVRESSELLLQGVTSWRSLEAVDSVPEKISAATEARNKIQEAVVLVELAQDSMPGVQFPYCTKRELISISQAIEYVFTDILIEDRYRHAHQVYKNIQERATALGQWINQVLNTTLKRDLTDIDGSILNASKALRSERISTICQKLGIENEYDHFTFDPTANRIRPLLSDKLSVTLPGSVKFSKAGGPLEYHQTIRGVFEQATGFDRNLAARRNNLWPSRRVEELMHLGNR